MVNEDLDLVAEDVDEADEDEGIRDEGRPGQLLDVADQGEGCGRACRTGVSWAASTTREACDAHAGR